MVYKEAYYHKDFLNDGDGIHCLACGMIVGATHQYTCHLFITNSSVTEKDCIRIPVPAKQAEL